MAPASLILGMMLSLVGKTKPCATLMEYLRDPPGDAAVIRDSKHKPAASRDAIGESHRSPFQVPP
jgi:hypothetical protein